MDPKDVQRPDDIMSAADALLKAAPIEPITKREDGSPVKPEAPTLEAADQPAIEEVAASEAATEDGDPTIDPMAAREAGLAQKEADFNRRMADAEAHFRKVLESPDEYSKVRRELGLEQVAAEPAKPAGPDPIANPDAWRYRRQQAYERQNATANAGWTPDAIREAVERDLIETRDALYNERLAKLEGRFTQREQQDQQAVVAARVQAEQAALERQLDPLTRAAYPKGVPLEAKEDIDAHIALAKARGTKPDLAAIVAKVSGRQKAAIGGYVQQKRTMAAGAGASRSTGGQSPAPISIVKKLPPTLDSLTVLGDMLADGKLKR